MAIRALLMQWFCSTRRGAAVLFVFATANGWALGQGIRPLVQFTNFWKYDQSGADLGTAWRAPQYNDDAWPSGPGLLGMETTQPFPYPVSIGTPLWLTPPGGTSQVITYYFRTRFTYPLNAPLAGVQLLASNLVDDGCVIYLNGAEAGRVRVPTNQNFLTSATAIVNPEGTTEVASLNTSALVAGENVLAVEVHQFGTNTADVIWGMNLTASVPQPLLITDQPASQTNFVGGTAIFSVGVSGGPASFRWRRNGANIAASTNATRRCCCPISRRAAPANTK